MCNILTSQLQDATSSFIFISRFSIYGSIAVKAQILLQHKSILANQPCGPSQEVVKQSIDMSLGQSQRCSKSDLAIIGLWKQSILMNFYCIIY